MEGYQVDRGRGEWQAQSRFAGFADGMIKRDSAGEGLWMFALSQMQNALETSGDGLKSSEPMDLYGISMESS